MFPIPWNFPFRKKNGDVITISEVLGGGGGGGSDIPPHTSADAGKVLSVTDGGALAWDSSSKNLTPVYSGLSYGYVTGDNWVGWETSKTNYVLLFPVTANKNYLINKADTRGNRCRASFFANKTLDDFIATIENPSTGVIFNGVNIVDSTSNAITFAIATTNASGIIAVLVDSEGRTTSSCACIEL